MKCIKQASKNIYRKLRDMLSSDTPLFSYCKCHVNSKYLSINCNSLKEASSIAKKLPNATILLGHIDTSSTDSIHLLSPIDGELITLTQWEKMFPKEAYEQTEAFAIKDLEALNKYMLEHNKT